MHLIVVPPPVLLMNLDSGDPIYESLPDSRKAEATLTKRDQQGNEVYFVLDKPYTQYRVLARFIFGAKQIGKGLDGIRNVNRLKRFLKTKAGDIVEIDSSTRDAVRECIKEGEWNAGLTSQLVEHFEAWTEFAFEDNAEGRAKAEARSKEFLERKE